MLSNKMIDALNQQVAMEAYAAAYYLAMASWCDQKGYNGSAAFFYAQSDEEREHMLKIFRYINEMEGTAVVPEVKAPPKSFDKFVDLFQIGLDHERKVTKSIYEISTLARDENDFATLQLMQWFVDEQREEETQMITILDKLKLIGNDGVGLYMLDKELAEKAAQKATEAPSE
ncbi:MAG: ferritin [Calditrichia bacterium]|nr:ferritin [Calditrichota bacterium]MCB0271211.1 ferritin [Calditrichota bacterium]MCB9070016.1 ferritin [Calditrichia bacterium]